MSQAHARYTSVAIVLHWAIAGAILLMLPLGFWMHIATEQGGGSTQALYGAFQLHKSIGLTVLVLSLVRLGWRLANPPPPFPPHMPAWERFAARATHWGFYALTIALPLSGWVFVSAGWSLHEDAPLAVPTRFFGLFEVPALFGLTRAGEELRADVAEAAFVTHWVLAYAAIGLAVLHVGAALKHQFFDRDEVMAHMVPGLRAPFAKDAPPADPARNVILGVGLSIAGVAIAAALLAALSYVVANGAAPEIAPPQQASVMEIVEPPAAADETIVAAGPAAPPVWRVDARNSRIAFAYVYEDEGGQSRFSGRFTRWRADIRFDPADLEASAVDVRIETASAETGAPTHDNALAGAGWFNPGQFPQARFRAGDIRREGAGYEARGDLTIAGRTRAVRLPFTLDITSDRAVMNGRITIDRRDFGIGEDAEGDELIGRDVAIEVRVEAQRAT